MKKEFSIIVLASFLYSSISAQILKSDIVVGQTHSIKSEILKEDRKIQIYVPAGYDTAFQKSYPVLYVTDGQEYFLQGVAYQNALRFRDKTPPFIVVGIETDRKKRRMLFYEDSEQFIAFIKTDLIPYVDQNFRTKKEQERIYFGWEMAGGLGLEILGEQSQLFSGYILASTTHSGRRLEAVQKLKLDDNELDKSVLFAVASEEKWAARDSLFMSCFTINEKTDFQWRYSVYDREDHYTTPNKAIHEGLSDYFSDYKPIRFYTLKEYEDFGGLEALNSYYKRRGIRYDLSTDIHKETKHFLLFNSVKENNYGQFQYYENIFEGYLESYTRPVWFNRFGLFYCANGQYDKSEKLFSIGLLKFPESSLLHNGLGNVYKSKGKRNLAKKHYQKAIDIAMANNEPGLSKYQKDLNNI